MLTTPTALSVWERQLLTASLVLAVCVAVLGAGGAWQAVPLGHLGACLFTLFFGFAIVRRSMVLGERGQPLGVIGAAWLVWASSELIVAVAQISVGAASYPTIGHVVGLLSVPLLLIGAVMLPRPDSEPWEWLRVSSESIMMASALTVLWWSLLGVAGFSAQLRLPEVWLIALVPVQCSLWALTFVLAMREKTWAMIMLAVAASIFVPVNLVSVGTSRVAGESPWIVAVLAVLITGPTGIAVLRIKVSPAGVSERSAARAHTNRQVWTNSASVATFLASIAVLVAGSRSGTYLAGRFGVLVISAVMVFAAGLWLRDFARLRQFIRLTDQLTEMAYTDPLTCVGNRRALEEWLVRTWDRALQRSSTARPVSLLTVDLDGFKDVNTLLGHSSGDRLLSSVGGALSRACGSDRVYRLGGDEFAVTWAGTTQDALGMGEQILDEVRDVSMQLPGVGRVGLSASVGVATVWPGEPGSAEHISATEHWSTLLLRSGEAMRSAKSSGKAQVALYSQPMAAASRRRSTIERRLREQLAGSGVAVRYQPLVHLASGHIVGFEALAYWNDEDLGLLMPCEFIGVAEDTGLIGDLGHQVLVRALTDVRDSGAAAKGLWISVNVSVLQLRCPAFVSVVVDALSQARIPSSQLVIEVTESMSIAEGEVAAHTLQTLSGLGVVVALDDFGSGYSSLAYLSRLPVQLLKLDREIAQGLDSPRVQSVARAVIDMAGSLGVDVLAEGLESVEHVEAVRTLGVTYGQGWFFDRPLTADRIPAAIQRLGLDSVAAPAPAGRSPVGVRQQFRG